MPGAQVIWYGLNRLHDMAMMYSILNNIKYQTEINSDDILSEEMGYS